MIVKGDATQRWATDDNSLDSVVTDPPYGISFMGKAWDDKSSYEARTQRGIATQTFLRSVGYEPWQAGFVAFTVDWATEAYRTLKPGSFLLAFAGTKADDLTKMGIRLAGFEIIDTIEWLYLTGFPKAQDIGKMFDKRAGVEREVVATIPDRWAGKGNVLMRATQEERDEANITIPATPLAQRWNGWKTPALKPAHEGIVVARKPSSLSDLVVSYLREVHSCLTMLKRLGGSFDQTDTSQFELTVASINWNTVSSCLNVLDDLLTRGNTFTIETALDMITELRTLSYLRSPITLESITTDATSPDGSSVNASRVVTDLNEELSRLNGILTRSVHVLATSTGGDTAEPRSGHTPIVVARKPFEGTYIDNIEKWGVGAINVEGCRVPWGVDEVPPTPKQGINTNSKEHGFRLHQYEEGRYYQPPAGGRFPANVVTLDEDEWYSTYFNIVTPRELSKKASTKERKGDGWRNTHETVKPVALVRWLQRLVTPPGGRTCSPFLGSGTDAVAAIHEGFEFFGIEKEDEYFPIINARIADTKGGDAA